MGQASPRVAGRPERLVPDVRHSFALHRPIASRNAPRTIGRQVNTESPVVIDGRETPELIPDRLAYKHFFSALASLDRADGAQTEARNSYLARLGLSSEDALVVLAEAADVRKELDVERLEQRTSRSAQLRPGLAVETDAILDRVSQRLLETLTPDGYERLDAFVHEHVKPRIVIREARPR